MGYQEFSDKLDRLDSEFDKKMEEQNKKFFADKPDESTLSPEMKEHYDKFEKMIKEHAETSARRCASTRRTLSRSSRSCSSSRRTRSSLASRRSPPRTDSAVRSCDVLFPPPFRFLRHCCAQEKPI